MFGARGRRLIGISVMVFVLLAACGGQDDSSQVALPAYVKEAPPRVREAYTYAAQHPDELMNYPCYCGCGAMGHTSNLSCYISETAPDGTVTFDNHAVGCGICVDITQDVMRLRAEGQSPREVRAYVDAQYSAFGPGTDTPLPVE
jgi:hypothetical protein